MDNQLIITSKDEWAVIKEQAATALKSGLLPNSIKTAEQASIIALKGRELGLPIMQSLASINVIQGKPTLSAELMLALVYKNNPGAVVQFVQTDSTACVIKAKRSGGEFSPFSFTMDDAKKAGVLGKSSWQTYPAAMLRARCISAMARAVFPDAIMGCYDPEEMEFQNQTAPEEEEAVKSVNEIPPAIPDEPLGHDFEPTLIPPEVGVFAKPSGVINHAPQCPEDTKQVSEKQLEELRKIALQKGISLVELRRIAKEKVGVEKSSDMNVRQYKIFKELIVSYV